MAALLAGKVEGRGRTVALLSGGNIDASLLIEVARHSPHRRPAASSILRTYVRDRPGGLAELLGLIAEERVNVLAVQHQREGLRVKPAQTAVELTLQTRDEEHCLEVLARMREWGYEVERMR